LEAIFEWNCFQQKVVGVVRQCVRKNDANINNK